MIRDLLLSATGSIDATLAEPNGSSNSQRSETGPVVAPKAKLNRLTSLESFTANEQPSFNRITNGRNGSTARSWRS